MADPVYARVEELGLQDRVRFTGYVPEDEKALWYNAAPCFCYPSLYEGFGLPPLEAMACGVPVVTSNVSSLPEVVGGGGLCVDPDDIDALTQAMWQTVTDGSLRERLRKAGLVQASHFHWQKTAQETISAYRHVFAMRTTEPQT